MPISSQETAAVSAKIINLAHARQQRLSALAVRVLTEERQRVREIIADAFAEIPHDAVHTSEMGVLIGVLRRIQAMQSLIPLSLGSA